MLGGLGSVLDSERQLENKRYGEYDQARINALGTIGNAQERVIGRNQDIWNTQMLGTQTALAESKENMFGGLNSVLRGGMYADENGLFDKKPA